MRNFHFHSEIKKYQYFLVEKSALSILFSQKKKKCLIWRDVIPMFPVGRIHIVYYVLAIVFLQGSFECIG